MPDWLRLGTVAVFGVALAASILPLTRYRRPSPSEIDRRIERSNALAHAPVTTQTDRLSGGDNPFANALWREHQKRMAAGLDRLSGDMPRTRIPERDPWAVRAVVALLLVTAFAFSVGPRGGSVLDAFRASAVPEAIPARIDAWVTPPPYTGRAPVFLTAEGNREQQIFRVPAGSDFSVRITGGSNETLSLMDEGGTEEIAPEGGVLPDGAPLPSARQFTGKLSRDGVLALQSGEQTVLNWTFQVIPDTAPQIRFAGDPKRSVNGTLELQYEVEDDYGATAGAALFAYRRKQEPDARPLYDAPEMPLTLPRRNGRDIAASTKTRGEVAGSTIKIR
ncbi:MAG: DUF4175 family protein, partial [Dehalococcoidia bacterium]